MFSRGERAAPVASSKPRFAREAARFAVVGGVGVAVNLLVFNLLRHTTQLPVVRASVIATVVSIAFNYAGFRYFAYRERDRSRAGRQLALFLLFSALGLVIENGILYLAANAFGRDGPWESNVFKFTGIAVATLFRFLSYRTWVFRVLPERGTATHAPPRKTPITAERQPFVPGSTTGHRPRGRARPTGATAMRSARSPGSAAPGRRLDPS
ncbi:GtrA family protein [Streptomyces sp. NBC_01497]|uniref:GtrA family protein n=1 Tax=Streptomyces sp. NBC_01497 TaxID=2903885 RepID=UPI002E33E564|nr:GtrA family protein [Streptomyces sp. NBC_01497]